MLGCIQYTLFKLRVVFVYRLITRIKCVYIYFNVCIFRAFSNNVISLSEFGLKDFLNLMECFVPPFPRSIFWDLTDAFFLDRIASKE